MTKNTTPTHNQTQAQAKNAPIFVKRSGAVVGKLWENPTAEGGVSLSVTFARTYTDPKTGEPRESRSFYDTDILKVQHLARPLYAALLARRKTLKDERTNQDTPLLDGQS